MDKSFHPEIRNYETYSRRILIRLLDFPSVSKCLVVST